MVAGALLVIASMVYLQSTARTVSHTLQDGILAETPHIDRSSLAGVLKDIPQAPFLELDEAQTNSVATRLVVNLVSDRSNKGTVLVFRTDRSFDDIVTWYEQHLKGWSLLRREIRQGRGAESIPLAVFHGPGHRMALMPIAQLKGRVVMVLTKT